MQSYSLRPQIPENAARELESYPELLRSLLFYRGITTKEEANKFLNPDYDRDIHDAYLMKDMEKAVNRVLQAIESNHKIVIYSDYDCDGIPGGVVFHDFFKKIGFLNFENYFPHRFEEGYGLHVAAVENFAKEGVNLIITIDCGTSDVAAVTKANELGIDVIVTDHHLSQESKLPPAFAILNPKQKDCQYPYRMLCGSGVAYKFIQAILKKKNFGLKEGMEKWFLDMVGLATLADMVPLKGENRVLAHYGLKVLRKTPRLGLVKLLRKSKILQQHLSEDDIGFTLAPRINAASRMGKPSEAFDLLTAFDEASAEMMSDYLNKINDERKGAAAAMTKELKKIMVERFQKEKKKKVIVVGNPKWKPALIGPVANNLSEAEGVPVFVWGRADGTDIKGSCRSDGRINLLELMNAVEPGIFLGFGGHRMSGGFSISHEKIHLLEDALCAAYEKIQTHETEAAVTTHIDATLAVDEINWKTYGVIEQLAPFGIENEKPVFLIKQVVLDNVKLFGKEKNHLELTLRNGRGNKISAIGFFVTDESFGKRPAKGECVDLVVTMEKSMFRNFPELRLRIIDVM
jgi:single-stranded-DNA-specific exonuclease